MSAALAGSPQGPGSSGAFACDPPLDASCTRTMTLIRALPSLTDTERPRNASVREQLQQLEDVAREEIRELQQLADARPAPSRADEALLGLAWDLGLDGEALK
ncbi:Hypothetical protein EPM1_1381 [Stenotrophomonas maltophilia EPM1]|nr:Hypothetical protein EPM1_1381 [Stenotrophomonas maltophilia EPM1]